ncbi:MAG: hypothetical protein Q8O51_00305 [bacterium]|nr:hypothetical protein [bacterium]
MSRKLLYIFGGTILVLVIVVLVVLFLQRRTTAPKTNTNATVSVPNVNTVILPGGAGSGSSGNTSVTGGELDERKAVERIATDFASIYGSFSTQNNFRNITDLYFYMAPPLKAQQEAFVAAEQAKRADTSLYKGITSVARITTIEQFDLSAGTAQVKVTLQRAETSGTVSETNTYPQALTLNFERSQGAWKVARLAWGPKQ